MKMWRIFRAAVTLLLAQTLLFPAHTAQAQGVTVSTQGGKTVQIDNQTFVVEKQVMQIVNGKSTAVNRNVPNNDLVTGPVCGAFYNKVKQPECNSQFAVFEGAAIGTCPAGTEFDIGRWSCWSCDKSNGFKRGAAAVDSDRACVRPATAQEKAKKPEFQPAQYVGDRCPPGAFFDTIGGGSCWSCPDGYKMNMLVHVQNADKCTKPLREEFSYAELSFRTGDAGHCVNRADGTDRGQLVFWDANNYGGNGPGCWKCPVGFGRNGYPVYDEHACSRITTDNKPATQRTGGGCEKGTFTHTYNVDLTGMVKIAGALGVAGANELNERTVCLKCPESYDQVIAEGGDSPRKCQTTNSVVFGQATKESALTCQSGQEFDLIGLTQQDINTRPQFKGQSSKPQPVASGTCWSCAEGYYRSLAHVKSEEACGSSGIDYYSGIMRDPGLFGLDGAAEVLAEILAQDAKLPPGTIGMVEQALNKWVDEQGKIKAKNNESFNRANALREEANLLATQPQKSGVAAALVFARVLTALADEVKATDKATAAEKRLVASFTQYVKMKRTFIGHMVKRQYDIWLDTVHYRENDKYERTKLLFDRVTMSAYGRPPSFEQAALLATAGAGALDLAAGTALAAIKIPVPLLGEVTSLAIGLATGGYENYTKGIETALLATTTTAGEMAFGIALTAAVDALVTAAIVHTITVGAITTAGLGVGYSSVAVAGACAASTALASTGIGIGAVLIVASMQLEQLNQFLDAPVKVGALVAQAAETKKGDLSRMGQTSGGMTELLTYWSTATGGESQMGSSQKASYEGFGQQHAYMKNFFPAAPKLQFEIVSQTDKSCLVKKGAQAVLGACGAVGDGTSRWMVGPNNTLSPAGFDNMCLTANGAALTLTQCNMPSPLGGVMPVPPTQMWQLKDGLVMSATVSCLAVVPDKAGNVVIAMPCNPTQAPQKWAATAPAPTQVAPVTKAVLAKEIQKIGADVAKTLGIKEEFAKTTRYGKGTGLLGTDCPKGQFWNVNGYCYSCPQGFNPNLNPVDSDNACSKPVSGDGSAKPAATAPSTQPTQAAPAWQQMPGAATDIGMGGGMLWAISNIAGPGGYAVVRWDGKAWVDMKGGAVRIDVDGKGFAFIANDKGEMFRYNGSGWTKLPGLAKDVGVGEDGTLWCIGANAVSGGFGIYRWNTAKKDWDVKPGGAVRIDVDPNGNPWAVNDAGQVYTFGGSAWVELPGVRARDIGVGVDGSVFVAAKDDGSVYKLDRSSRAWIKRDGLLDAITVDSKGIPFGANASKQIWMGYP